MNWTYFSIKGEISKDHFDKLHEEIFKTYNNDNFDGFSFYDSTMRIDGNGWKYDAFDEFTYFLAEKLKDNNMPSVFSCRYSDDYGDDALIISKRGVTECLITKYIDNLVLNEKREIQREDAKDNHKIKYEATINPSL